MDKLLAVIRREFFETVRTKSFMISTLLVPVIMAASMTVPMLLARQSGAKKLTVGVADQTGALFDPLDRELQSDPNKDYLKDGARKYELVAASPEQLGNLEEYARYKDEVEAAGKEAQERKSKTPASVAEPAPIPPRGTPPGELIKKMKADALVEIRPKVLTGESEPIYYSENVGDFEPIRRIENALNSVVMVQRFEGTNLPPERIKELTKGVDLTPRKVKEGGEIAKGNFGTEYFTAIFFAIMLYMMTMMSGMALSRGLLEEKGNRIIEILVSSVTPFQLMTGKILGHALVILSQLLAWSVMGAALYMAAGSAERSAGVLSVMNLTLLGYLGVYFLLGYLLYAALFAAVGAICTTEMEAQQTQTPILLLQMVPLLAAIAIVRQPDSGWSVGLSMFPFTAPSIMMMRMALKPPPMVEILASIGILILSVAAAFWAVSKIFRVGILMTGKKMTIPEVVRWLRAA